MRRRLQRAYMSMEKVKRVKEIRSNGNKKKARRKQEENMQTKKSYKKSTEGQTGHHYHLSFFVMIMTDLDDVSQKDDDNDCVAVTTYSEGKRLSYLGEEQ